MPYITSDSFKGFLYPDGPIGTSTTTFATFNINNDDMGIAFPVSMPEAATITRVMLYCTVANTLIDPPSVRLEGIAADGQPNNISLSGASVVIPNTAGFLEITLTTPYAAAAGEELHIVIRQGNQSTGNQTFSTVRRSGNPMYPAVWSRATGAANFTKITGNNGLPQAIVGSTTKWYGIALPLQAHASAGNFGYPQYVGFYFKTPANYPELFLTSVWAGCSLTAGEQTTFEIYNTAGTVLYTSTVSNNMYLSAAATRMTEFLVVNGLYIQPNTKYYVMFRSTNVASFKETYRCIAPSAAAMLDFSNGIEWGIARYSSGTFIDTLGQVPSAALQISGSRYFQTSGGATVASLPAGFNQLDF
jgi:hypothetical protein